MKILIPFTPHLAYECLETLGERNVNIWPKVDEKLIENEVIKIAVQINGKTREIFEVDNNIDKQMVIKKIKDSEKIKKYLTNQNIQKEIYVPGKILNFVL